MSSDRAAGPVTERRIEGSGGVVLAVQERGRVDQPIVVLVHGYPDDHAVWDLVAERLADELRVVTYDVRGAGTSDAPGSREGYRLEVLVADLGAVIDAVSPDRPIHMVGHDWGSIQCWSGVTDPVVGRRIASFTSMSGPGLAHVAAWMRAHRMPGDGRWRDLSRQALRSWYIAAFRTPIATKVWRDGGLAQRLPRMFESAEGADVDDRWPGPHLVANGTNGLGLYRANMAGGSQSMARTTDVPVQLIVPRGDRYVTPALLDGIERVAPDLVRHDVDGGHWLLRSNPDLVARLIAEHVASVEAEPAPGSGSAG